jgi:multidrug efflux system outer membrane protein
MRALQHKAIIFCSIVITIGCGSLKKVQQLPPQALPGSFGNNDTSTAGIATMRWQQYFADVYLQQLIDTAILNNQDIAIALQRMARAEADVILGKGMLKPVVEGTAGASLRRFGLYTMDGAGNITTEITPGKTVPTNLPDYFIGLQTSWELDVWGKLRNQRKAAVARLLATAEGKNLVLTNVMADIAATYYELLGLDEALKIINENIALQENALHIVKVQKEAAVTNELAVEQFEAQLLNLYGMRIEIRQRITEAENRINVVTGRFPQPVARDSTQFAKAFFAQARTGVPTAMLQNRPDIRQAELELDAARADVQAARAAFYPSLNLSGGVGFQAFKTSLLFTTPESLAFGLFGNLAAPLINRSAIKANFHATNAAQVEAIYNYQKAVLNGFSEVYNEIRKIQNLDELMQQKTKEVAVLAKSIETSAKLFKNGRATYLEVLIAQQNFLQSKLELVDARKRQLLAAVNIYKAVGGGWR